MARSAKERAAFARRRRDRRFAVVFVALAVAALGHGSAFTAVSPSPPVLLVPGGTPALLQAAGVRVPVEPERALLALIRQLHVGRGRPEQIDASIATASRQARPGQAEPVPALLPADVWRRAVFGRDIPEEQLAGAILRDRKASFLYYGLFALDDETLSYLASSPGLLATLYKRLAVPFAACSEGIRVRGGRVLVPGGASAEAAWERTLLASPGDPVRFVTSLLERPEGRAAQLFEALGRLDPPRLAFALGPNASDVAALVAASEEFDAYLQPPFGSWSDVDVSFLLQEVGVTADGRMAPPRGRAFWAAALSGEARNVEPSSAGEATAAWLVARFAAMPLSERRGRFDALRFAQRLAAGSPGGQDGDGRWPEGAWLEAASSFPSWQTLFLTLEQVGATDPGDYRAAARAAAGVTAGRGAAGASRRLAIFQSAIALVAHLARVGTLAPPAALDLLRDLFARGPLPDDRFAPAMSEWIEHRLLPRLPDAGEGLGAEERLLDALAGPVAGPQRAAVEWEGRQYVVDLAAAERERLASVRDGQGGPTLDDAIGQPRPGDARRPDLAARLADVLVAHVYALSSDPDAPMVAGDGPWRRHDFALSGGGGVGPWLFARQKAGRGAAGSLLGIERALAREALRPTMMGLPPRPPTLSLEDATGLAESVVALNPFRLDDEGRDRVAAALRAGRDRLSDAARQPEALEALLASAGVDGIRRRLAGLAAAGDRSRVFDYVSLSEVLHLGSAHERIPDAVADSWGPAARLVDGSLGQRMPVHLAWRERSGRPGSGLLSAYAADLQLRVAEWLAERRLPAALAGAILSRAVWDLSMTVQAAGADDWLPVVRAGQAVPAQRFEDYVSALAAGGPLVAAGAAQ